MAHATLYPPWPPWMVFTLGALLLLVLVPLLAGGFVLDCAGGWCSTVLPVARYLAAFVLIIAGLGMMGVAVHETLRQRKG